MGCFSSKSAREEERVQLSYTSSPDLALEQVRVDKRRPAWAPLFRERECDEVVRLVYSPTPLPSSVSPPSRDFFVRNQTSVKVAPPGVGRRRRW